VALTNDRFKKLFDKLMISKNLTLKKCQFGHINAKRPLL